MDVLGIGPLELIVILILALVFFGPERLPQIGAKLGKSFREMRRATREFSRELEQARAALEAPVQEVKKPLEEIQASAQSVVTAAQAMRDPASAIRESVMRELKPTTESAGSKEEAVEAPDATLPSPPLESPELSELEAIEAEQVPEVQGESMELGPEKAEEQPAAQASAPAKAAQSEMDATDSVPHASTEEVVEPELTPEG